jgi:hypothetical protein
MIRAAARFRGKNTARADAAPAAVAGLTINAWNQAPQPSVLMSKSPVRVIRAGALGVSLLVFGYRLYVLAVLYLPRTQGDVLSQVHDYMVTEQDRSLNGVIHVIDFSKSGAEAVP